MKYLKEYHNLNNIYYHGTISAIPFNEFVKVCDGTGICNIAGEKYGGFFFTSSLENAEFYTEWFICKVRVKNITVSEHNIPRHALMQAIKDNKNYLVKEVLDGIVYSDILVVPHSNLKEIEILEWIYVGEEQYYYDKLDSIIGDTEDNFVSKDMLDDFIESIDLNIDYLLTIPIFKKYYDSK